LSRSAIHFNVIVVSVRNRRAIWPKIVDHHPFDRERKYFPACTLARTLR